jgi:hypothetical protein
MQESIEDERLGRVGWHSALTKRSRIESYIFCQMCRLCFGVVDAWVLRHERVKWEGLNSIGRRTSGDSVSAVMGSGELEQREKFPPLVAWQRGWLDGTFNHVLVKIHQDKVVRRKLNLFVSALDTDNVRTRRLKSLDQPCGKDRDQYARPGNREQ